jgi:hypothetical protein
LDLFSVDCFKAITSDTDKPTKTLFKSIIAKTLMLEEPRKVNNNASFYPKEPVGNAITELLTSHNDFSAIFLDGNDKMFKPDFREPGDLSRNDEDSEEKIQQPPVPALSLPEKVPNPSPRGLKRSREEIFSFDLPVSDSEHQDDESPLAKILPQVKYRMKIYFIFLNFVCLIPGILRLFVFGCFSHSFGKSFFKRVAETQPS